MKNYKIYKLIDPRTDEVRYIGFTISELNRRLDNHLSESRRFIKKNSHKENWIRELLNLNLKPKIELLEECSENNWEEREKYWISQFNNLTNKSKGGEAVNLGIKHSRERILKVSKQIYQYTINGEFIKSWETTKDAALYYNISKGSINRAILKNSICIGFQWSYEYSNKMNPIKYNRIVCPILQYNIKGEFIKEWKTFMEVCKCLNISSGNLSRALKNNKKARGYLWRYKIDEYK